MKNLILLISMTFSIASFAADATKPLQGCGKHKEGDSWTEKAGNTADSLLLNCDCVKGKAVCIQAPRETGEPTGFGG